MYDGSNTKNRDADADDDGDDGDVKTDAGMHCACNDARLCCSACDKSCHVPSMRIPCSLV